MCADSVIVLLKVSEIFEFSTDFVLVLNQG